MVLRISSALWFKGDLFLTNIGKLSPVMNSNIHTVKMLKYQILIPILYTQFYLFIYIHSILNSCLLYTLLPPFTAIDIAKLLSGVGWDWE